MSSAAPPETPKGPEDADATTDLGSHPWSGPILRTFGFEPADVELSVHSADEMLEQAVLEHAGDRDAGAAAYLTAGAQIAATVADFVTRQWSTPRSLRILDFGSGFGRVTRFLLSALEGAEVWSGELVNEAVRFQREVIGARSFPSHVDPRRVSWPDERFDLIYVGSLFTHLPAATFRLWLEALTARLSAEGVLLFSVHDASLKPAEVAMGSDGLAFLPRSESRSIDHRCYGSAWVDRSFLEAALEGLETVAVGGRWLRMPRALCGYQDLVAVSPGPLSGAAGGLVGAVDAAELEGSKHDSCFALELGGWVLRGGVHGSLVEPGDRARAAAPTVHVHLFDGSDPGGVELAAADTECSLHRDDLRSTAAALGADSTAGGWSVSLELPHRLSRGRDLLLITCSWEGAPSVLYAGSVDALLLRVTDELHRRRRDRVYELAETIDQVKASRFWRLRRAWFRIKRRLGWTGEDPDGPVLRPGDRR